MPTYIPRTGERVRVVAVHPKDAFAKHPVGSTLIPTMVVPCAENAKGWPSPCVPRLATCVYLRSKNSPGEGTWCRVEPVHDGITDHALLWRRALCNAVRAAMADDTELAITWLEAAQALEDVCPEYAGFAYAIAVRSGLSLHERSGELR